MHGNGHIERMKRIKPGQARSKPPAKGKHKRERMLARRMARRIKKHHTKEEG